MPESRAFKPFLPDGPPYPKRSKGFLYTAAGGCVLAFLLIVIGIWAWSSAESDSGAMSVTDSKAADIQLSSAQSPDASLSSAQAARALTDSSPSTPNAGLSGGLSSRATRSYASAVSRNAAASALASAPASRATLAASRASLTSPRASSPKPRTVQVADASFSTLPPRGGLSSSPASSAASLSSSASPADSRLASPALSGHSARPSLRALGAEEDAPAIHQAAVSEPLAALTFDDGPSSLHTRRMMDFLESNSVKATFFFIGKQAKSCPDIVAETARRGFEIGNHTFNHKNLRNLDIKAVASEIEQADDAYTAAGIESPALIRFPYGNSNKKIRRFCHGKGLSIIDWSIDTRDWERKTTAAQVYQKIEKELCPGAIILLHEHSKATWEALPRVLELLKSKGYQTVTVSELLARSQPR